MLSSSSTPTADFDGAWKEAFERYFQPLVELCFPKVAEAIDWTKPIEFLNRELQKITHDAAWGDRFVDVLVRVTLKNGQKELLILHIEIQTHYDAHVEARTFDYNIRITLRYPDPVVSLVILADNRPDWKPHVYHRSTLGCEVRFQFPVCKLLDLAKRIELLQEPISPAAIIILAHVRALETHGDMTLRLEHKWQLLRDMYNRGWGKQEFLGVYRLLDWFLQLPKLETLIFEERVITYEQEQRMEYITSIEQLGIERGMERGLAQGFEQGGFERECKLLTKLLCKRFPSLDTMLLEENQLRSLSAEKRSELTEQLLEFTSLSEVHDWLQRSLQ